MRFLAPLNRNPSRLAVLAVIVIATAVGPLSLNIFLPSMPGLQAEFGVDYGTVQLTLSLYLIGFAVAQLFYGTISDRWGRRPAMLGGLVVFFVGSMLCATSSSIDALIVGRCIQALGACAALPLGRAVIRDLYDREHAASMIAYVTMVMVVAPMLAPAIGGFLDQWAGWRTSFFFVTVAGVIALIAIYTVLPETLPKNTQSDGIKDLILSFGHLMRLPAFLGYGLQVSFSTAVFFSFIGGAPYVMVELMGRPPSEYGLYFMINAFAYMVGNFTAGRYATRIGIDRMITAGVWITLFGTSSLVVFMSLGLLMPQTLFGCLAVVGLGQGFSLPTGVAGAVSVDAKRTGAASGLMGFFQMALGSGVSYAVGQALDDSAWPMVIAMAIAAACSVLAHVIGQRVKSSAEREISAAL